MYRLPRELSTKERSVPALIKNCYDLLAYIQKNSENNTLNILPNTHKILLLSEDELNNYVQKLVDTGYAKRYVRSIAITQDGLDSLD